MSSKFPGLLFANRTIGSFTTKSWDACVTVFPVITKLPEITRSPDIVPPVEFSFVLAVLKAPLA